MTTPGIAQANQWSDHIGTFEGFFPWNFWQIGDGTGGIINWVSHSGDKSALLGSSSGVSIVERQISLWPVASGKQVGGCAVDLYVRPAQAAYQLNLEIIDASTYNYIAVREIPLSPGSGWVYDYVQWLNPRTADVIVRIGLLGNRPQATAWVDDVAVVCQYY